MKPISPNHQLTVFRSFVHKIVYEFPKVTIYYDFPLVPQPPMGGGETTEEVLYLVGAKKVLGIDKKGSPSWTIFELSR